MDKESKKTTCQNCEVSESGAPVFRYTDGEKEWESAQGEECIEEISNHIEKHIGEIDRVFHELVSDTVHIDVHHVRPTKEWPYHTLVTSGMSDLPMNVPDEYEAPNHTELMLLLPESWIINDKTFYKRQWNWPINTLRYLARFPHKYDTWFGWGHTIPHGDPAVPFADNTKLNGVILLESYSVPEDFLELKIDENKAIHFLSVIPLYDEEMSFKLKEGSDALLEKFEKYSISEIIDINRRNVMKKRFGLF